MKQIWKYPISPEDKISIYMPEGAEVLTVQLQDRVPCLWAMVNVGNPLEVRRFRIYGTGMVIEEERKNYIGTFQSGLFVWHLFEECGGV